MKPGMNAWRALAHACAALALVSTARAAPLPVTQIAEVCKDAEDQAHCGRLIEEVQRKRLPGLVERAGDELRVALFPSGVATFRDSVAISGAKTFALWDYLDRINAVVLFTTDGEETGFLLLRRTNGRQYRLPAEPALSPDRTRLVTADICAQGCSGEVAIWRVDRDGMQKEMAWKPNPRWVDATATWKDADTLTFDFQAAPDAARQTQDRKLTDAGWNRSEPR